MKNSDSKNKISKVKLEKVYFRIENSVKIDLLKKIRDFKVLKIRFFPMVIKAEEE